MSTSVSRKSPNHPSMRRHSVLHPSMKKFIDELAKSGSVTALTEEESDAVLESMEFDGCIARPKDSSKA